jgi:hypothetical protein
MTQFLLWTLATLLALMTLGQVSNPDPPETDGNRNGRSYADERT